MPRAPLCPYPPPWGTRSPFPGDSGNVPKPCPSPCSHPGGARGFLHVQERDLSAHAGGRGEGAEAPETRDPLGQNHRVGLGELQGGVKRVGGKIVPFGCPQAGKGSREGNGGTSDTSGVLSTLGEGAGWMEAQTPKRGAGPAALCRCFLLPAAAKYSCPYSGSGCQNLGLALGRRRGQEMSRVSTPPIPPRCWGGEGSHNLGVPGDPPHCPVPLQVGRGATARWPDPKILGECSG